MHTRMHTCTHAHMHTCTHAHMHTCTHTHSHTRTHACTHAHMHTCTHAHMHAYTLWHTRIHTLTRNGGGHVNFSKLNLLIYFNNKKFIFMFFALQVWDFRNAGTCPPELNLPIKSRMHICPGPWAVWIPTKFGFRPILGQWRSILWKFSAILCFDTTGTDLPAFLLYPKTAFFEAHVLSSLKTWRLCSPKSCKVFMVPSYTIVTP